LALVERCLRVYNGYMDGLTNYKSEYRPWGSFELFTLNERSTVKILTINPHDPTSLQTHEHRAEFWRIIKGSGTVCLGEDNRPAAEGDSFFSPVGTKHRIIGGVDGLSLLEISFGEFDEDDITRLEDNYGRL